MKRISGRAELAAAMGSGRIGYLGAEIAGETYLVPIDYDGGVELLDQANAKGHDLLLDDGSVADTSLFGIREPE